MSPAHYYKDPKSSSEVPSWLTLAMFIMCTPNGVQFFAVKNNKYVSNTMQKDDGMV